MITNNVAVFIAQPLATYVDTKLVPYTFLVKQEKRTPIRIIPIVSVDVKSCRPVYTIHLHKDKRILYMHVEGLD